MNNVISTIDRERLSRQLEDAWRLTPATMGYKITKGQWIPAKHLLHISTIVATQIAAGNARIILTMPPRHGKSEFVSVNTPIWHLEKWPNRYVMQIAYGLELATDFSLKVRETFQNEDLHHLLRTRINPNKRKIDRFLTMQGGGLTAAGVGGTITGRGGHLLTVDDYIKNAEAALSEAQRNSLWEWWLSTAWTRREPGCSVIILATRWHQDDLIGRVLTEQAHENWTVINLPALAEENDPLGRAIGEPLWPERYDLAELENIKKGLGSYWWDAMYQQHPRPSMSGADLGGKLRIIDESEVPHHSQLKIVRVWDFAATEGGGDWTVGSKIAYHKASKRVYHLDTCRFRKSPSNTEIMVQTVAEHDGRGVKVWIEQEPGSSGKQVIEHYQTSVLRGYDVSGEKVTGPVEVRAQPVLAAVEAGSYYAVKHPEVPNIVEELDAFPDGDHDDIITTMALGYYKLVRSKFGNVVWGRDAVEKVRIPNKTEGKRIGVVW